MAKKSAKVAFTYALTMIISFLVLGGILYYFMTRILVTDEPDVPTLTEQTDDFGGYIPVNADKRTLLLIVDTGRKQTASCFILVKLLPVERKLMLMSLPTDSYTVIGGEGGKLYDFYRTEGSLSAVKAVENITGVTVDKYMKVNQDSLITLIDVFGGVEFNIPDNLIDEDHVGGDIIIKAGRQYLDSELIRKVVTFPSFDKGEEYRAQTTSLLITELINKNLDLNFNSRMDDSFTAVINSGLDTNVSAYDYEEIKEALKYVADGNRPAHYVLAAGQYDENGFYVFDENFVKSLNEWFKLYDDIVE